MMMKLGLQKWIRMQFLAAKTRRNNTQFSFKIKDLY